MTRADRCMPDSDEDDLCSPMDTGTGDDATGEDEIQDDEILVIASTMDDDTDDDAQ